VIVASLISYPQAILLGLLQGGVGAVSDLEPRALANPAAGCSAETSTRTTNSSASSLPSTWRPLLCFSGFCGATGFGS
jgi:hypothetical protein